MSGWDRMKRIDFDILIIEIAFGLGGAVILMSLGAIWHARVMAVIGLIAAIYVTWRVESKGPPQ